MLRGFTDSEGVAWRVWDVLPSSAMSASAAATFARTSLNDTALAHGWLCFESETEKRRLAPIPDAWRRDDAADLEAMCAAATPVRGRPVSGRQAWASD